MTKGKMSLVLVLALVLSLGLAASASARGDWGRGPGGMNLTPDQAGKLFDLKQKFMDDTAGLRKQMWVKRAEVRALWRAANPDQKQIEAKQKEINAIRDQLQPKMTAFRLEARKIAPQAAFGHGMGFGHGMDFECGMGPGGGRGPGRGMGPGGGMGTGPAPQAK